MPAAREGWAEGPGSLLGAESRGQTGPRARRRSWGFLGWVLAEGKAGPPQGPPVGAAGGLSGAQAQ